MKSGGNDIFIGTASWGRQFPLARRYCGVQERAVRRIKNGNRPIGFGHNFIFKRRVHGVCKGMIRKRALV